MSIREAMAFGHTKVGIWHYCTDGATRFGQTNTCADCSGFVSRCLWEGGMAHGAFPESSGDMARWFVSNPTRRLDPQAAKRIYGAVLVYGGFVNGPHGHVVFSMGDGTHTLESSGSGAGVNHGNINRLVWSHAGLAPISYAPPAPPPPPVDPEVLDVEHGMAVDVIVNPNDHNSGYTLDRWGGVHPFGAAKPFPNVGYWPGLDAARRIVVTDWSKPAGYVMDLDGGLHAFGGNVTPPGAAYWKGGKLVPISEL